MKELFKNIDEETKKSVIQVIDDIISFAGLNERGISILYRIRKVIKDNDVLNYFDFCVNIMLEKEKDNELFYNGTNEILELPRF